jgi:nicotinate-nucleotide--dimethylbenzimidazole phosphoribosyltransferase
MAGLLMIRQDWEAAAKQQLDGLAKPPGSLGRLETLAVDICRIQQTLSPRVDQRRLVIFAADHGVTAEGVSAWPSAVTAAVRDTVVAGGAASSVLATVHHTECLVIDVGVLTAANQLNSGLVTARVRSGTRNLLVEPALTPEEFEQAVAIGQRAAEDAAANGMQVVIGGEIGIGNTTAASLVIALATGVVPRLVVGRGAGADDATWARKLAVVTMVWERYRTLWQTAPREVIPAVCGLEIAALAGFFIAAAARGLTIVVDGVVTTAALLIAEELAPRTRAQCLAAHAGAEPGHRVALEALRLRPYLDGWELRLGEGTGGLLLLPLMDAAVAMLTQMTTLAAVQQQLASQG